MKRMGRGRAMLLAGSALLSMPAAGAADAQEQAVATAPREAPVDARDAEILELRAAVREVAAQGADLKASTSDNLRAVRDAAAAAPAVTLDTARPQLATADGAFKFALRSVVQFDVAASRVRPLTAANDIGSGTNFRRARFGFDATAFKDWNLGFLGEFGGTAGESAGLNQAYIEYAGLRVGGLPDPIRLRAGAWATPASLEDATPNTEGLFLERPAISELVRGLDAGDGRTGVGLFANGEHWYLSAVLTGKVVGVPSTPEYRQQRGFVTRLAWNPLHGPDHDVHLGGSIQGILSPADTAAGPAVARAVRLHERPELRVSSGVRLVDTGAIAAEGLTVYGLEAGASWSNLYAAGEWMKIDVDRSVVGTGPSPFDPTFSGWYLQGAWTLTGERHVWNRASGGFRGVRPAHPFNLRGGGLGAWEIAGRYSVLDLNDRSGSAGQAAPAGGVRGGRQAITSAGLNWYPNAVLRFQLEYQWDRIKRLSAAGADIGEHVDAVSFRSQFSF